MSELERVLKLKVDEINGSSDKRKKVSDWIDGYRGKIVQFVTKDKACHIVFTKEDATLREGEYPCVEVTYRGEEDVLLRILKGQSTAKAEIKAGALEIWHNMHETVKFEEVLGS